MTRVWITRTEPGASHLAETLISAGLQPVVAPVLTIRGTDNPCPTQTVDIWVFVSVHAVVNALANGWTPQGQVLAVGPTTASALKRVCTEVLVPKTHNSEGLFDLIRRTFDHSSSICVVKGSNGRPDLAEWLKEHGFSITNWPVYEQIPSDSAVEVDHVDYVIASSVAALAPIYEQLKIQHATAEDQPTIVVPSDRIASRAHDMGFANVIQSNGASSQSVLDALLTTRER